MAPNFAVYTKWKRPNGTFSDWTSIGGEGRHTYRESDLWLRWCAGEKNLEVYVYGTNGRVYNDVRLSTGRWFGWEIGTRICFDDPSFPG